MCGCTESDKRMRAANVRIITKGRYEKSRILLGLFFFHVFLFLPFKWIANKYTRSGKQIATRVASKLFNLFEYKYLFNDLICSICVPHASTPSMKLDAGFLNLLLWADHFLLLGGILCTVGCLASLLSYPLVTSNTHHHQHHHHMCSTVMTIKKCLLTSLNVPWEAKITPSRKILGYKMLNYCDQVSKFLPCAISWAFAILYSRYLLRVFVGYQSN